MDKCEKENASADVIEWASVDVSADNPSKPKAKALWRRRIHIGTTGMPVGYSINE